MKYMSNPLVSPNANQPLSNFFDDVVISCECNEPEGTVIRNVRLLTFTPYNLAELWKRAQRYRTLFRFEIGGDFKRFMNRFVRQNATTGELRPTGLFWVVDDFVGLFYMTDIDIGVDAVVHYTFFDGRHHGRDKLVLGMLKYGFEKFNFNRMTVEIPLHASPRTHNFVELTMKFKKEGRKRGAAELNGKYYDLNIYGILRSEVLKENG